MARITVEDCLEHVDNQFDLVMLAAKRARRLANGADPLVETENDKPTVIALREIAEGLITEEILEQMSQPEEDILSSEQAEELLASTPLPSIDAVAEAGIASAAPAQSFNEAVGESEPGTPLPGFQEVAPTAESDAAAAPAEPAADIPTPPAADPLGDLGAASDAAGDIDVSEPKRDDEL